MQAGDHHSEQSGQGGDRLSEEVTLDKVTTITERNRDTERGREKERDMHTGTSKHLHVL